MSKKALLLTLLIERIFYMENKEYILEKIRSDDSFGNVNAEELTVQLDRELAKPNPDYDLVDELSAVILEARGKAVQEIDVQSEIKAIKKKADNGIKRFRCPRWAVAASAACLVLIGANTVSVAAWGTNIFSAFVQFTKGDLTIDFGKQEQAVINLPTSEDDPYGIKAKCAEYDIYPMIPYYLPDGFKLTNCEENILSHSTDLRFFYENDNTKLILSYEAYKNSDDIPPIGIPTDTHNLQETEINGQTMYVLKEDNQFTAAFLNDSIVYIITSNKLDYDECQKVVESMK